MKGILAIIVGVIGAIGFLGGWIMDPEAKATLVTSFICGFAAIFAQMSTRDLASRSQALIDRGADEYAEDGGELHSTALAMKDRIERLILAALVIGAFAPFFATLRTIFQNSLWSALAFSFSAMAMVITIGLFSANRSLGSAIDRDRVRRAQQKRIREELLSRKTAVQPDLSNHPNLKGYGG